MLEIKYNNYENITIDENIELKNFLYEYNDKNNCLVFVSNIVYNNIEEVNSEAIDKTNILDKTNNYTLEEILAMDVVFVKIEQTSDIDTVLNLYKSIGNNIDYFEIERLIK